MPILFAHCEKTFCWLGLILCLLVVLVLPKLRSHTPQTNGAPPYGESLDEVPILDEWAWLKDWKRPEGPPKVGLQVGHWKNDELPEELSRLIGNTGASGGGKSEWEVNYAIAEATAELLRAQGVQVDILPATIPPDYWADVFIAIHADGSTDTSVRGFKIAAPWRDRTGKAEKLVTLLETEYQKATGFRKDDNITRNMRGYYAFAYWRYDHAIHPMTTPVIVETGFLTNAADRDIIVRRPDIAGNALATGTLNFLTEQKLINN